MQIKKINKINLYDHFVFYYNMSIVLVLSNEKNCFKSGFERFLKPTKLGLCNTIGEGAEFLKARKCFA